MAGQLTFGGIRRLFEEGPDSFQPVLQISELTGPSNFSWGTGWFLYLSDSHDSVAALINSSDAANFGFGSEGGVCNFSVVQLQDWRVEERENRVVLHLSKLHHVRPCDAAMGTPQLFTPPPGSAPASKMKDPELRSFCSSQVDHGVPGQSSEAGGFIQGAPQSSNPYARAAEAQPKFGEEVFHVSVSQANSPKRHEPGQPMNPYQQQAREQHQQHQQQQQQQLQQQQQQQPNQTHHHFQQAPNQQAAFGNQPQAQIQPMHQQHQQLPPHQLLPQPQQQTIQQPQQAQQAAFQEQRTQPQQPQQQPQQHQIMHSSHQANQSTHQEQMHQPTPFQQQASLQPQTPGQPAQTHQQFQHPQQQQQQHPQQLQQQQQQQNPQQQQQQQQHQQHQVQHQVQHHAQQQVHQQVQQHQPWHLQQQQMQQPQQHQFQAPAPVASHPMSPQASRGGVGAGFASPASGSNGLNQSDLITIDQLSAYRPRWRLEARITKKTSVRQFKYKSKEGEGQMFSIDIIDARGTEARGAFFGQAVDIFYNMLQERQLFSFSGGRAKKGDKRFCSFDWEINFDEKSKIAPAHDDGAVPQMIYDFKPLSSLDQLAPGSTLDVACIFAEVEPVSEVTLKVGGFKSRQNVTLLDDSGASCKLSLWGEFCQTPWEAGNVALLKGVRVSDFGGRSLNTTGGTNIAKDSDALAHSRGQELSEWYRMRSATALQDARQLSSGRGSTANAQTIEEIKAEAQQLDAPNQAVGNGQGAANGQQKLQGYHTVVPATVTFIPHERPPFYMACSHQVPDERNEGKMRACNRKVEQMGGSWTCSADHQCQEPIARWIAQFLIADWSGGQYVSSFDEQGQKILGCSASEAARLWESKETDTTMANQLEELFKSALFKRCKLRIKSKKEIWMDEERIKMSAVEVVPLDFVKEARAKLDEVTRSLAAPAQAAQST